MHAQGAVNYGHFKGCRAYETAFALKREGRVRRVGISFHDTPEMLERILTEYPELEVVQIQFNYVDYEDPAIQSRRCCEVCRKHHKPVIVMEPDFKPLNETELAAVNKVQEIFHKMNMIPCTACRYCVEGCPKQISIPDLFAIMNTKQLHHDWNADYYYEEVHTAPGRRASDCLKCGKCEKICPQHLPIRKLLEDVAKEFDKPQA